MHDIFQHFPIKSPATRVFEAVSTPKGLDSWWTLSCSGSPSADASYVLGFGPGYDWIAKVTQFEPNKEFEIEFTEADGDWAGTRVGFALEEDNGNTTVRFHHTGWPEANDHYRVSCYCWSMYLRLLKRYVERGEVVEYDDRLEA